MLARLAIEGAELELPVDPIVEAEPCVMIAIVLAAVVLFALAAWRTRAGGRPVVVALVASLLFAAGNIAWDVAAARVGWWRYPSTGRSYGLWHWYFGQALVFGGALGLVGLRVLRRRGRRALALFLACVTVGLPLRDFVESRTIASDLITFGDGAAPWIADAVACFTLEGASLVVLSLLAGPGDADPRDSASPTPPTSPAARTGTRRSS